jgi:hypothetical protein
MSDLICVQLFVAALSNLSHVVATKQLVRRKNHCHFKIIYDAIEVLYPHTPHECMHLYIKFSNE